MKINISCRRADLSIGIAVEFPKKHRDQLVLNLGLVFWILSIYFYNLSSKTTT